MKIKYRVATSVSESNFQNSSRENFASSVFIDDVDLV